MKIAVAPCYIFSPRQRKLTMAKLTSHISREAGLSDRMHRSDYPYGYLVLANESGTMHSFGLRDRTTRSCVGRSMFVLTKAMFHDSTWVDKAATRILHEKMAQYDLKFYTSFIGSQL